MADGDAEVGEGTSEWDVEAVTPRAGEAGPCMNGRHVCCESACHVAGYEHAAPTSVPAVHEPKLAAGGRTASWLRVAGAADIMVEVSIGRPWISSAHKVIDCGRVDVSVVVAYHVPCRLAPPRSRGAQGVEHELAVEAAGEAASEAGSL